MLPIYQEDATTWNHQIYICPKYRALGFVFLKFTTSAARSDTSCTTCVTIAEESI